MEFERFIAMLWGHRVFIQTHNFPDPDALASAQGLKVLLTAQDIESIICYDGTIEKSSTKRMIDTFGIEAFHIDEIEDMSEEDYIVMVDGQKYNSNLTDLIGDEVACIDHHPTMIPCTYKYKDVRIVGACATLITHYFVTSETTMDRNTASVLLYGIRMDTDNFTRGVTALDIQMFAYLHELADNQMISSLCSSNMEINDLRAYGEAIRTIQIYDNIGFAKISFDCPDALVAMISEFIMDLDVIELAIVYAKRQGGLKFSVRNENENYHAGLLTAKALADVGGGGGHYSMAGGLVRKESMHKMLPNLEASVRDRFLWAIEELQKEELESQFEQTNMEKD